MEETELLKALSEHIKKLREKDGRFAGCEWSESERFAGEVNKVFTGLLFTPPGNTPLRSSAGSMKPSPLAPLLRKYVMASLDM